MDEATLAATEAAIRAVNGSAAIVRTRRCAVDVGRLLNQGAYSGPAGDLLAAANDGLVASLQLDIREDAAQHAGKHEHHGSAPAERPHSPDGGIYEHAAAANAAQPPAAGHDEADGEAQGQGAPSHHGSHLHARRVTSVTLPCQRPLSLDRRIYVPTSGHCLDTFVGSCCLGHSVSFAMIHVPGSRHVACGARPGCHLTDWHGPTGCSGGWKVCSGMQRGRTPPIAQLARCCA